MTEVTSARIPEPGEIDLAALARRVWSQRWTGMLFVVACVAMAVAYLHAAPHRYMAVMVVTPADQSGSKAAGNLAGLGSLVGLNLNEQAGSAFSMYGEAATSYAVAQLLNSDRDLMKRVFPRSWNDRENRWQEPPSAIRPLIKSIKSLLGMPIRPWHEPDASDLKTYLDRELSASEDKRKAAITLSYENEDAKFARIFLGRVNAAADGYMREQALARATTYVEYLEQRLAQVQVAEYRQSMAQVLGNYEKTRMMASSTASYAAEPFGGIWVSQDPTSPKPLPVIALGFFAGLAIWLIHVFAVLPAFAARRRRRLQRTG
ncbi:hypothetical protein GCM10011529_15110 [Polymorphobacter glacialis]|uniref:Polysaccharide chain length determinant N-terminal domain-containing protein n=1 Tax=Sandarakinorhabdus glacialis TaxID=1614636 RepID=A0A917E6N5_9SPHN|nr:Wzz/FepE/Etk N-terminal domain-containing protein [Polymorphobacter glacialis]GGE09743.1 hypothetical protein GCM10011529_15110 [Polymorphobacter glacialis]